MTSTAEARVLLVEDNPDDVDLTKLAFRLNRIRAELVVARDGAEALEYLYSTGSRSGHDPITPALILLDLKLPRMNGLEVLRRLRSDERTRSIPVVILTSSAEDRDYQEVARIGAELYVRKPVDFVEFRDLTRHLAVSWLGHAAEPEGAP
ncbi:MAG TPA: response regulator [Planctomycetota bacterium]|nr:response regulator [Planctomycetota bacterium]